MTRQPKHAARKFVFRQPVQKPEWHFLIPRRWLPQRNRIRRNFKPREEAAAEQAALTIKALQLASNLRSVATSLAENQVREAAVAFRRIAACGRPLSFYVHFTLTNYREPARRKRIAGAVTAFEAAKQEQRGPWLDTVSHIEHF